MYKDLWYVANDADQEAFREALRSMALNVLPHRPAGEGELTAAAVRKDRRRLLSYKREEQLEVSDTNPYPHYSEACEPLLSWDVPYTNGKRMIAGWIRHHAYMEKHGPEFVEIGKAFAEIRKWMKVNWQPLNRFDFIGPGATDLLDKRGHEWSCFDPDVTKFAIVRTDGTEEDVSYEQWLSFSDDEARRREE
jgi:hypothetical protein